MSPRDPTSARYFNQAGIKLRWDANVDAAGFDLANNAALLARLTGAPDYSTIHISRLAAGDGLILRVSNAAVFQYPSEYALATAARQGTRLLIDSIYVRKELQGLGVGTRSVVISLTEAKTLGCRSVALTAAGSARNRQLFFGYHVWPVMGFDALLPAEKKLLLPPSLAEVARLSGLMQSEAGRRWWYDNGIALDLEFDLVDASISWQLLDRYVKRKGICV